MSSELLVEAKSFIPLTSAQFQLASTKKIRIQKPCFSDANRNEANSQLTSKINFLQQLSSGDKQDNFLHVAKCNLPIKINKKQKLTRKKVYWERKETSLTVRKRKENYQQKQQNKIQFPPIFRTIELRKKNEGQQKQQRKNKFAEKQKLKDVEILKITIKENQVKPDKVIQKSVSSSKLNLGLRKKGKKSQIKQMMQNILARTKVDDVITIKRSQYQHIQQNNFKINNNNIPFNDNQAQIQRSIQSNAKRDLKNKQQSNIRRLIKENEKNKKLEKLPNVCQYKNIVEMIKKDEQKKHQRKQKQKKEQIKMEKYSKIDRYNQSFGKQIIEQQIQQSMDNNISKNGSIKQSIVIQFQ